MDLIVWSLASQVKTQSSSTSFFDSRLSVSMQYRKKSIEQEMSKICIRIKTMIVRVRVCVCVLKSEHM